MHWSTDYLAGVQIVAKLDLTGLSQSLKELTELATKPLEAVKRAIEVAQQVVKDALETASKAIDTARAEVNRVTADCKRSVAKFEEKKRSCRESTTADDDCCIRVWIGCLIDLYTCIHDVQLMLCKQVAN